MSKNQLIQLRRKNRDYTLYKPIHYFPVVSVQFYGVSRSNYSIVIIRIRWNDFDINL